MDAKVAPEWIGRLGRCREGGVRDCVAVNSNPGGKYGSGGGVVGSWCARSDIICSCWLSTPGRFSVGGKGGGAQASSDTSLLEGVEENGIGGRLGGVCNTAWGNIEECGEAEETGLFIPLQIYGLVSVRGDNGLLRVL